MTDVLFLDFETYYEPKGGYSLSKMPTMQYIRDKRFECLGCGFGRQGKPWWVPGDALPGHLSSIDWSTTIAVAHNAAFDGAVLAERYGCKPAHWIDTKSWAQYAVAQGALPPDASTSLAWLGEFLGLSKGDTAEAVAAGGDTLAAYGLRDIEITRRLLDWLATHCPMPDLETRTIDLHVRMAAEPVLQLDVPLLTTIARGDEADPELAKAVRSRSRFAVALRACGVEPGTKTSPTTGKSTLALAKDDAFMRGLARHADPRVRRLHELRVSSASTIAATRAERFLAVGAPMPVPLWYYGAHTGRSSGADKLNMQNLPRAGFRDALVAPEGHRLVAADYSQVEARVLAWGAQDAAALAPFLSGRDPYKTVAADLYNCAYDEVDDEQRRRAKAAVLALGFGQGPTGFMAYCERFGIEMEPREADRIVQAWRRGRPAMVRFWSELYNRATTNGELTLPSGRKLTYPDIRRAGYRKFEYQRPAIFSKRRGGRDVVRLWPGLVTENWVQAVARDIIWHAAVRMPWRVVMQIHDEVIMAVPTDEVPDAVPEIERVMLSVPGWAEGLPVACEVAVGQTYGECK